MLYLVSDLVNAIKRNATVPVSQIKFQDDDFIAFLNEELDLMVTGELMRLNEEYFVTSTDTPLVASQAEYDIPIGSAAWRLREIGWVDTNDNYNSLNRIPLEYIDRYKFTSSTQPMLYYLKDNKIVLTPTPSSSVTGSLRIYFEKIQNELVDDIECGQITVVADGGANWNCTLNNLPTGVSNGVDCISGTQPYGLIAAGVTVTTAPLTIFIAKTAFTDRPPAVGDWFAQKGYTPIAHIPEEYNPILAQLGTIRYFEASGDEKGIQSAQTTLARLAQKLRERSQNRTKASPIKIRPKDKILNIMRGRVF